MRLVDLLQLGAALFGVLATAMVALEQRAIRRLRIAGATTPECAIELSRWRGPSRWFVARLLSVGVVVANAEGRVYFDEAAWVARRKKRRALAAAIIVLLAIALVLVVHAALA